MSCAHLKVISKRPISQHFKECMVVHILANIIQVIVFTTCTNTFLAVYSTLEFGEIAIWIYISQKDWLILCKNEKDINYDKDFYSEFGYKLVTDLHVSLLIWNNERYLKLTSSRCENYSFRNENNWYKSLKHQVYTDILNQNQNNWDMTLLIEGNGYTTYQSSLLYVFVCFFWGLTLHKTWENKKGGYLCSYMYN